ncbi:MAG: hypothetical protein AB1758_09900 [Candidatus Eremiobacterota bacterium]
MQIDVNTYYRNRLALEEAVESARRRAAIHQPAQGKPLEGAAVRRVEFPTLVFYGLLCGLVYAGWVCWCLRQSEPPVRAILALGLLWGAVWGVLLHAYRERLAAFLQEVFAPAPAVALLAHEDALDLSWMDRPVAANAPVAPVAPPAPAVPARAWTPGSPQPTQSVPQPTLGSMISQLTDSYSEGEPKSLPAKGRVWGNPLNSAPQK